MASIGLRYPYYAIATYDETNDVMKYSGGGLMGKAISFSAEVEISSDNNLYADDAIAETDNTFSSGTITLGTDDLTQDLTFTILGLREETITVDGVAVKELVYDDSMRSPELGVGIIIPKQRNGVRKYRAVIYTRVKFAVPSEEFTTKGETIEWQTPEIEGTVMRDQTSRGMWKREATFESDLDARKYIKQILNIALTAI